jgi:Protein of unknown function (DUF2846)
MHGIFQRTAIPIIALLAVVSLQARQPAAAFQNTQVAEIVLIEGTPLHVVTTQAITSKTANLNDVINFKVDEDLVVNGQVVIRKGTPAIGSVMHATKGGYMGKSGKLGIQVEWTQTVDDARLKLRAAKGGEGDDETNKAAVLTMISPLGLFKKGGEAKIEEGTRVTVYVAEEKRFRVGDGKLVAIAPAPVDPAVAAAAGTEAVVYVYRPGKWVGKALEPSVFVDDIELARMDNGRYFTFKLPPGKHIVHMTQEKKGFAIDMGPGQTYYFRVGIEMGMMKGRGKITLEDAAKAQPEIKKLKFIGQDKIKNPTMVVQLTPDPPK